MRRKQPRTGYWVPKRWFFAQNEHRIRGRYSATYRHGSDGQARFQMVKNGTSRVSPVVILMVPMLTPRSPVAATITSEGDHSIFTPGATPAATDREMASGP